MTAKRRRARRGDGSVYYARSARRWEAVITVTDPDTGKRRRVKQTGTSKEDAERLLAKMVTERRDTGTVARKDVTVADAIADRCGTRLRAGSRAAPASSTPSTPRG